MYRLSPWETPNLHLAKFPQLQQTRLPSSSAPPHGRRTTLQPVVHLVARLRRFALRLVANAQTVYPCPHAVPLVSSCQMPKSCARHVIPPAQLNDLRFQPPFHLRVHLHGGRSLTRVAKTPMPSRRTNASAQSPRARLAQRVQLSTKSSSPSATH